MKELWKEALRRANEKPVAPPVEFEQQVLAYIHPPGNEDVVLGSLVAQTETAESKKRRIAFEIAKNELILQGKL